MKVTLTTFLFFTIKPAIRIHYGHKSQLHGLGSSPGSSHPQSSPIWAMFFKALQCRAQEPLQWSMNKPSHIIISAMWKDLHLGLSHMKPLFIYILQPMAERLWHESQWSQQRSSEHRRAQDPTQWSSQIIILATRSDPHSGLNHVNPISDTYLNP